MEANLLKRDSKRRLARKIFHNPMLLVMLHPRIESQRAAKDEQEAKKGKIS